MSFYGTRSPIIGLQKPWSRRKGTSLVYRYTFLMKLQKATDWTVGCHTQYIGLTLPVHIHLQPQRFRLLLNQSIKGFIQRRSSRLPPQFLPSPRRNTAGVRSPQNGAPRMHFRNFLARQGDDSVTLKVALSLRFGCNSSREFTPRLLSGD